MESWVSWSESNFLMKLDDVNDIRDFAIIDCGSLKVGFAGYSEWWLFEMNTAMCRIIVLDRVVM